MDDDIGLFDYPIDKFASIFYNCLVADNSIHLDDDDDTDTAIYADKHIHLSLTYTIDGGLLEGRLKVCLSHFH